MTTITIDRAVVEQALEAMRCGVPTGKITLYEWDRALSDLRAPLAQEQAEPVQEPYTDDVTRIMREAGVTFHLGLPHKAVVEQMTRVVDLVYAEASIKAAQQFAATPPQRKPLTDEEEIERIRADEREACATRLEAIGCDHCAANIRARGKEC